MSSTTSIVTTNFQHLSTIGRNAAEVAREESPAATTAQRLVAAARDNPRLAAVLTSFPGMMGTAGALETGIRGAVIGGVAGAGVSLVICALLKKMTEDLANVGTNFVARRAHARIQAAASARMAAGPFRSSL